MVKRRYRFDPETGLIREETVPDELPEPEPEPTRDERFGHYPGGQYL